MKKLSLAVAIMLGLTMVGCNDVSNTMDQNTNDVKAEEKQDEVNEYLCVECHEPILDCTCDMNNICESCGYPRKFHDIYFDNDESVDINGCYVLTRFIEEEAQVTKPEKEEVKEEQPKQEEVKDPDCAICNNLDVNEIPEIYICPKHVKQYGNFVSECSNCGGCCCLENYCFFPNKVKEEKCTECGNPISECNCILSDHCEDCGYTFREHLNGYQDCPVEEETQSMTCPNCGVELAPNGKCADCGWGY